MFKEICKQTDPSKLQLDGSQLILKEMREKIGVKFLCFSIVFSLYLCHLSTVNSTPHLAALC